MPAYSIHSDSLSSGSRLRVHIAIVTDTSSLLFHSLRFNLRIHIRSCSSDLNLSRIRLYRIVQISNLHTHEVFRYNISTTNSRSQSSLQMAMVPVDCQK